MSNTTTWHPLAKRIITSPWRQSARLTKLHDHLMDNETSPERITQIAHSIKRGLAANVGEFVKCSIGVAPQLVIWRKVATDLQKPDGFTFISQQDLPDKLHVLKLRDLPGIGSNMERRLNMAGIYDMKALLDLGPQRMRKVWGSVLGERMWYFLRGYELPDEETTKSTIGHSHVMAPELREPSKAKYVARRLTLKAASRLRRRGYFASAFHLCVRIENGPRIEASEHCYRAQDSVTFLHSAGQRCMRKQSCVRHVGPESEKYPCPSMEADRPLQTCNPNCLHHCQPQN